jgi:hypothetical protein
MTREGRVRTKVEGLVVKGLGEKWMSDTKSAKSELLGKEMPAGMDGKRGE